MTETGGSEDRPRDDRYVCDCVDAIKANTDELATLRREVQQLRVLVVKFLGIDGMTQVLETGFENITEELRHLVPQSTAAPLDQTVAKRIKHLRDSVSTADLSDIGRLDTDYKSVSYVGTPIDDGDALKGAAS